MTQGFPAQPGYGAPQQMPQQFAAPQGYAPPAQPQVTQPPAAPQQAPQPGGFWQQQDPYIQAQQGPSVPPPQQAAPQQQQADTSGFWGGAASISFDDKKGYQKGTFRGGQIISKTISNQTKMGTGEVLTWKDGTPRKQMAVLLQTAERADPNDNGQRQLFIKGDLPRAVREAMQKVGHSDIAEGGWLYAAWVDEKPATSAGYNPQKVYTAIYAPPGSPDPLAGQHIPAPQPGQGADQFATYAAYQQHGVVPVQPNGTTAAYQPGQQMAVAQPSAFAQAAAPEVAGMPSPAAQAYQQAQGQPAAAPQQFMPQAPQPGTFQPGAQQNPPGQPQAQQMPDPSGQQPGQWTPFG